MGLGDVEGERQLSLARSSRSSKVSAKLARVGGSRQQQVLRVRRQQLLFFLSSERGETKRQQASKEREGGTKRESRNESAFGLF